MIFLCLLLLFELLFFLRGEFHHSLEYSLLEPKVFHRHVVHQLDVLLKQSVEVLDEATRLPRERSVVIRNVDAQERRILLIELELGGH